MPGGNRYDATANMDAVEATGIFRGVRRARVARGTRDRSNDEPGMGIIEVSLDSWEAPLLFEVTSVQRDAGAGTVYRGTLLPLATSQDEIISVVLVDHSTRARDGTTRTAWEAEVTRSSRGDSTDSVLVLRGPAR